ncbi:MAG: acetate--CoA ligase family protein [Rhodospirillaceae bacterium]|nr:acetate--CoA ligase family protein [Rhodospirillaceae bacterium]MBT4426713.1 acetate--CoA ligase family protein [Rhodospirillaceae bacterium]
MTALSDLRGLLSPRSIAIIGATPDLGRVGGRPIAYLKRYGFAGDIFPVNPKHEAIDGLTCYPSIDALPEVPDMAILAVPARIVCSMIEACQAFGVKAFTAYSSGFAESGQEGALLEQRLRELIQSGGSVLCGPNSQGIANFLDSTVAYFTSELGREDVAPGPIGFVSHSGVFGGIMATECIQRGLGLGYLVSTGNEAGIDFADAAAYMAGDSRIRVVAGYMEGVRDAEKLRAAAEIAQAAGKPLVILKAGRNAESAAAAASHTGALAGAYACHQAAFRQWGILEADNSDELFDIVEAFALTTKRLRGRRIGILTNSGGIGVLCADQLGANGLEVPAFESATEEALAADMQSFVSPRNPVDVALQALDDPDCIARHAARIARDNNIDAVLCFPGVIRRHVSEIADAIAGVAAESEKPVLAGWLGGEGEGVAQLHRAGVAVYPEPARAARVLRAMLQFSEFRPTAMPATLPDMASAVQAASAFVASGALAESDSRTILSAAGIENVKGGLARNVEEALSIAGEIGYPVVLKIDSADIAHKSEIGGVVLGLTSDAELRQAFGDILERTAAEAPGAKISGIGVYEMVRGAVELIAGIRRDPIFGPVVLLGMGGVFAEILDDNVLRVMPMGAGEADAMVRQLRGFAILDGARGRPVADIGALAAVLERLAALALTCPEIEEIDINPLMLLPHGEGARAADALVVLRGE